MNFKQWLLKEDPDISSGDKYYSDKDALTATIFKNFYIYAPTSQLTHEQTFFYLYLNNINSNYLQLIKDKERKEFITLAVQEKQELFPHSVQIIGKINPTTKRKLIKEFNEQIEYGYKNIEELKDRVMFDKVIVGREKLITTFTNCIFARIWTSNNLISFWNAPSYIFSMKNDVYAMLKHLGLNPKNSKYEVMNSIFNYEKFDLGNFNDTQNIDISKLHTMTPGPEKTRIIKSLIKPQYKPPIKHEGD